MVDLRWGNSQDAAGYELKQAKAWLVNGFPTATSELEGVWAYNTATDQLRYCNGSAWVMKATDSDALGGNAGSFYLDRTNHSGNIPVGNVTGVQALVNATPLDNLAAADGDVNFGGFKAVSLAAGSASTDAVRKDQLDAVAAIANAAAAGVSYKAPVRAVSTTNITLSGAQTIDTVSIIAGDRVLVAGQSTGADNGIYVAAAGAWSRATDADTTGELAPGTQVVVNEGSAANKDQPWYLQTDSAITIGTTAQVWNKLPYPTGEVTIAGLGMTKTGVTLDVIAGIGLASAADSIGLDRASTTKGALTRSLVVTGAGSGDVGFNHALANQWVNTDVYHFTGTVWIKELVPCTLVDANNVTFHFGATPADNTKRLVVTG